MTNLAKRKKQLLSIVLCFCLVMTGITLEKKEAKAEIYDFTQIKYYKEESGVKPYYYLDKNSTKKCIFSEEDIVKYNGDNIAIQVENGGYTNESSEQKIPEGEWIISNFEYYSGSYKLSLVKHTVEPKVYLAVDDGFVKADIGEATEVTLPETSTNVSMAAVTLPESDENGEKIAEEVKGFYDGLDIKVNKNVDKLKEGSFRVEIKNKDTGKDYTDNFYFYSNANNSLSWDGYINNDTTVLGGISSNDVKIYIVPNNLNMRVKASVEGKGGSITPANAYYNSFNSEGQEYAITTESKEYKFVKLEQRRAGESKFSEIPSDKYSDGKYQIQPDQLKVSSDNKIKMAEIKAYFKAITTLKNKNYATKYVYTGNKISKPLKDNFETNNSEGKFTFSWYKGSEKIEGEPSERGTYTLKVDVAGADDYPEESIEVPVSIDTIENCIKLASDSDKKVCINMNKGNTTVPKKVFEKIKGKDIEIKLDMGDAIWTIKGTDVTNIPIEDIDLGVKIDTDGIPVEVINKVTGERSYIQISLNHDGEFGFKAVLTINLEAKNKGLYANLFYNNEQNKKLEFISCGEIRDDGSVDLKFSHASDYVIIIDKERLSSSDNFSLATNKPSSIIQGTISSQLSTPTPTPVPTPTPTPISTQEPTPTPVPTQEPTPIPTQTPTQEPTPIPTQTTGSSVKISEKDFRKNCVKMNIGVNIDWNDSKIVFNWGALKNVSSYEVYANNYTKKLNAKALVKTVKGDKNTVTMKKIGGKKLTDKKAYKIRVRAYMLADGEKVCMGETYVYHIAGKNNKKYTNVKSVKVKKKSVTREAGKTAKMNAKIVKLDEEKKLLPEGKGPYLRYCSVNTDVATVTKKGKIKAVKKGKCRIYAIAYNGEKKTVEITVKKSNKQ